MFLNNFLFKIIKLIYKNFHFCTSYIILHNNLDQFVKQFNSIHLFSVCYLRNRFNQKAEYQKKGLCRVCSVGYMMDKTRVYIATGKSRKIIRDAKIAEKKGEVVDWQKVLEDSHEARAIGKENQVRAVGEKK